MAEVVQGALKEPVHSFKCCHINYCCKLGHQAGTVLNFTGRCGLTRALEHLWFPCASQFSSAQKNPCEKQ